MKIKDHMHVPMPSEADTKVITGTPLRTAEMAIFALAGSLASVFFLVGTVSLYKCIYPVLEEKGPIYFVFGSLLAIVVSSLIVGYLTAIYLPGSGGSGMPNLKKAYRNNPTETAWKAVFVKLISGIISLGGGASLGNEGPTVYSSGTVALSLAGLCKLNIARRRAACAAGAAAGLAAAFNTPLAAITFVIEELSVRFNGRQLGGLMMATVIGAACSDFFGFTHSFKVPELSALTWRVYVLTPVAAIFATLSGVFFQRRTMAMRLHIRNNSKIKPWLRPLIGGLCVWVLGVSVYFISDRIGVFSLGYEDLSDALSGNMLWQVGLLLLVAKITASILVYAWGGVGGIFAPTLFFGAMSGLVVAGVCRSLGMHLGADAELFLAVVGMSACFGSVMRAPLTGLLIAFELTSRYDLIPALMIGAMVSQFITKNLCRHGSFNDEVLLQDGVKLMDA